jgi:hypothetical protein
MDNMNPVGYGLRFPHFHPLNFRDYRNYLPTAYDDSLSMQESLLQVLNFCNEIGLLNQNMSDNWNMLLGWIKTNGIDDAVTAQLNAWVVDGTFEKILDKTSLDTIKKNLQAQMDAYTAQTDTKLNAYTSKTDATIDDRFNTQETSLKSTTDNMMSLINNLQSGVQGTYPTLQDLISDHPNGTNGIFVTLDNQAWNYWDKTTNSWKNGGLFNGNPLTNDQKESIAVFLENRGNLITNAGFYNNDISSIQHNSGVGVSALNYDGNNWGHVIGNKSRGNTDTYFKLSTDDPRLTVLKYAAFKFEFDIIPDIDTVCDLFLDVKTTLGSKRVSIMSNVFLQATQRVHLEAITPHVSNVLPDQSALQYVNLGIETHEDAVSYSIAFPIIKRFNFHSKTAVNTTDEYKVSRVGNLFPDQNLLTQDLTLFGISAGNIEYRNDHGENVIATIPNTANAPYDLYSNFSLVDNIDLLDIIHQTKELGIKVCSDAKTDLGVAFDFFASDNTTTRCQAGIFSLYAHEEANLKIKVPKLYLLGLDTSKTFTSFNVVFTNLSGSPMTLTNIRFVDGTREERQKDNLLFPTILGNLDNNLLANNNGLAKNVNRLDGKQAVVYSVNQNAVSDNRDVYIHIDSPSKSDFASAILHHQWEAHFQIAPSFEAVATLFVNINSSKGNVSIPLGTQKLAGFVENDLKAITPLLQQFVPDDLSIIDSIDIGFNIPMTNDQTFTLTDVSLSQQPYALTNNIVPKDSILRNGTQLFSTNGLAQAYLFNDNNEPSIRFTSPSSGTTLANSDSYIKNILASQITSSANRIELKISTPKATKFTIKVTTYKFDVNNMPTMFNDVYVKKVQLLANNPTKIVADVPKISQPQDAPFTFANIVISNDQPLTAVDYTVSDLHTTQLTPTELNDNVENAGMDIPVLNLYGDMPTSSTDVMTNSFKYNDGTLAYQGFTKTSWQGQSSQTLPKKSYKFKPYSDSNLNNKLPMQIDPKFSPASDFVLKAFYSDPTLALDNLGNEVMHDLAATRTTFSKELNNANYLGFNYGKPVQLYFNNNYQGLYFFRSGSKEDCYGVSGKDANTFVIEGESESGAAMFLAPSVTKWGDGSGMSFDVEFGPNIPDTLTDTQKAAFNAFVKTVYDGDLTAFKGIVTPAAKEAAIDYIIFYNLMGSVDSCGRNLEYVTWDGGQHFMVIPYDFDQLFFNSWDGKTLSDKNANGFPVKAMRVGGGVNKYFDLIAQAFPQELNDRYYALRATILSESAIVSRINAFGQSIGMSNFAKEQSIWPIAGRLVSYQYLQKIVYERFKIVDAQFKTFITPLLK